MVDRQNEPPDQRLRHLRRENLARLLVRTFDMMERDVLSGFSAHGIDLRRTWLPVLRNVSLEGSRITEIANLAGLSKQTVGPLVKELVAEGILETSPDPTDGRAKVVRYTKDGLTGLKIGMRVLGEVEGKYAAVVGTRGMQELRATLWKLLVQFESTPDP